MATPRKANPQHQGLPKRPYTLKDIEFMNSLLRKSQEKIDARANLKALAPYETPTNDRPFDDQWRMRGYRKPFRNHSPIIQEKATEHLSSLLIKHKAKLDRYRDEHRTSAANGFYGILVATAVHLAKRDLGLIPPAAVNTKKGRYSRKFRSALRVKLGIQDRNVERVPAPPAPDCQVHQGNLEGI